MIGGIQSAAKSGFNDPILNPLSAKPEHRHQIKPFKIRRMQMSCLFAHFDNMKQFLENFSKRFFRYILPIDLHPFRCRDQMR